MDNLTQQLEQILNDPERIQQLMSIASSLGLQGSPISDAQDAPEIINQVNQVFHRTKAREEKQQALVRALLPYLKPGRQAKLERAMQIAHLSNLAGAALRTDHASEKQEADKHV